MLRIQPKIRLIFGSCCWTKPRKTTNNIEWWHKESDTELSLKPETDAPAAADDEEDDDDHNDECVVMPLRLNVIMPHWKDTTAWYSWKNVTYSAIPRLHIFSYTDIFIHFFIKLTLTSPRWYYIHKEKDVQGKHAKLVGHYYLKAPVSKEGCCYLVLAVHSLDPLKI